MQDSHKQAKQQKSSDKKASRAADKASLAKTPSDSPIALVAGVPASVAAAAAIPHPYTPAADSKSVTKKAEVDTKLADDTTENTKSVSKDDTTSKSESETDIKSAAAIDEQDTKLDTKASDSSVVEANIAVVPVVDANAAKPAAIPLGTDTTGIALPPAPAATAAAPVTAKVDTEHPVTDKKAVEAAPKPVVEPVTVAPAANIADLNQPIAKPAVQPVLEATEDIPIPHQEKGNTPKSVPVVDHSHDVLGQVPAPVVDSAPISSADVPVASVNDKKENTVAVTTPSVEATHMVAPLIPVTTITPSIEPTVSVPNTETSSPIPTSSMVSTTASVTRSSGSSSLTSSMTSSSTHSMNRTSTATPSSTTTIPPMSMGVSMYDYNTHLLCCALVTFFFMIYQA